MSHVRTTTVIAPLRKAGAGRSPTRALGLLSVGRGALVALALLGVGIALLFVGLLALPVRMFRSLVKR